ncbi:hypothetical protein TNIN_5861 [Trichonephila inaurata madagascariensis]|uniref:Uncharacterized protein n=1 Tax=Trichonephila inaurata madagascariensis TaxID=2747483 RepID=A0A8X6MKX9_9ARAC|nr:hypothetical protein TNIN_5861 [Trichonephila inaurata madagascariensis]
MHYSQIGRLLFSEKRFYQNCYKYPVHFSMDVRNYIRCNSSGVMQWDDESLLTPPQLPHLSGLDELLWEHLKASISKIPIDFTEKNM